MTTLTADEAQTIAKDAFLFGMPLVFIEKAVAKEGS
jgi:hypothetical protein